MDCPVSSTRYVRKRLVVGGDSWSSCGRKGSSESALQSEQTVDEENCTELEEALSTLEEGNETGDGAGSAKTCQRQHAFLHVLLNNEYIV